METVDMDASVTAQEATCVRPTSEPPKIRKQGWGGVYADSTQVNIHNVLEDAYYSDGGFAGNIPIEEGASPCAYTYVDPLSTELVYLYRVKMTKYYNYLGRIVSSVVDPVFSKQKITTGILLSGEKVEGGYEPINSFILNCDGTGNTYESMQRFALQQLTLHDVVFYTMTKRTPQSDPVLGVYKCVDVAEAIPDEDGRLTDITFIRGAVGKGNDKVLLAIRFFMGGDGYCYTQKLSSKDFTWKYGSWSGYDFKASEKPVNTGVKEMVVYAHLPKATPFGEFVPKRPEMKALLDSCLAIFQNESKINWLFTLLCLPSPVVYGSSGGILLGGGNGIEMPDYASDGGYLPSPQYLEVASSAMTVAQDKLSFDIRRMREIATENGINTKSGEQAQSAESKQYEFEATEQKLRGSVDRLIEMDTWVSRMLSIYHNMPLYSFARNYPDSFAPDTGMIVSDALDVYEALDGVAFPIAKMELYNALMNDVFALEEASLAVVGDEFDKVKQSYSVD